MKINTATSHPSVFISSTFLDLQEERKVVAEVLDNLNFRINALDIAPAADDDSKSEIIQGITECDFVILLVGERYGSIVAEMSSSKSVTHWEYIQAKLRQKSVLVYFIKKDSNDPQNIDDGTASQKSRKKEALDKFKRLLSDKHNPKYVDGLDSLKKEIENVVVPTYRKGLNKLLKKNEKLTKERDELIRKNEELLHMISGMDETIKNAYNYPTDTRTPRGLAALLSGENTKLTQEPRQGISTLEGLNATNLLGGLNLDGKKK